MAPARLLAYEQLPLALVPPPLQRVIHSCDCLWQAVQVCSLTLSHDGALSWEVLLCVNLLATTLTLPPLWGIATSSLHRVRNLKQWILSGGVWLLKPGMDWRTSANRDK